MEEHPRSELVARVREYLDTGYIHPTVIRLEPAPFNMDRTNAIIKELAPFIPDVNVRDRSNSDCITWAISWPNSRTTQLSVVMFTIADFMRVHRGHYGLVDISGLEDHMTNELRAKLNQKEYIVLV